MATPEKSGSTTESQSAFNVTNAAPHSFSHTVGSGISLLEVSFDGYASNSGVTNTVTWNGNSLTRLTRYSYNNNDQNYVEIWYLVSPSAATGDVVITPSAFTSEVRVGARNWTGVDTPTPFGSPAGAHGSSGTVAVTVTATSGDKVIDVAGNSDDRALTSTTTLDWDSSTGRAASSTATAIGNTDMGYTFSPGAAWWTAGVAIKGSAGGSIVPRSMLLGVG
jgi:hypothetical protein